MTLLDILASPWVSWGVLLPLLAVAVVDWRTHNVPRPVTVPLLVIGCARAVAVGNWPGLVALLLASLDVRLSRENGAWDTIVHGLVMFAGIAMSNLRGNPEYALVTVVSICTYNFWKLHWLGGGDGMLLVGLLSWQPTLLTLLCLVGGWAAAGVIMAVWQSRGFALARLLLPAAIATREALESRGVPTAFGFTLGWAAFAAVQQLLR